MFILHVNIGSSCTCIPVKCTHTIVHLYNLKNVPALARNFGFYLLLFSTIHMKKLYFG